MCSRLEVGFSVAPWEKLTLDAIASRHDCLLEPPLWFFVFLFALLFFVFFPFPSFYPLLTSNCSHSREKRKQLEQLFDSLKRS